MIHLDSIAHIRKVWSFPQVMSWNCSSSETEITHVISWHSYQLSSITFLKSTVPLPFNSSLLSFSLFLVPFFPFLPFIASLLSSLLSIPLPPCSPLLTLSPSLSFPLSPLYPPPLPSVAALPVTISPSIIWDLHWNSKTTSLWPTNVFTWDDTGELMFHRDKLFSVVRLIWGKVRVTRPSPNGWKEIEKLELTEKAMFSGIISIMLTCKLSWLSLLAHSVWRVHLKR